MMKLSYAPTSPFVRKANAAAIELGLEGKIERATANPWDENDTATLANPLGKIPALTLEDGTALAGSQVVCEYLDSLVPGGKLFPAAGAARFKALNQQSLADGIMEAGVAWIVEKMRRPAELKWEGWIDRQRKKIVRTLDVFEADAKAGGTAGTTIGTLSLACALGYLDFRFPEVEWRKGRPALTAFFDKMMQRPSLATTVPKAPA